ncbi:MAG: orotidine-5'-phosphate decarboxylase, partial [Acidobacteriota bacterium]
VVKPQIAFFEQLGWRGVRLLHEIVNRARSAGLLVVLDAKRGDIGSTAAGYARAYLGPDAPLPVDALTVYPYLGADSLAPFIEAARAGGSGLFVLVRTSNPGSSDVQDLCADDEPVYARVARMLAPLGESLRGATGWSSLGVVVGATFPEPAARVRKLLPHAPLLVPGYGAQGGSARDAVRAFVRGEGGRLEGGLVNASRSILFPPDGAAATDAKSWERAVDAALDRAINELRDAIAG